PLQSRTISSKPTRVRTTTFWSSSHDYRDRNSAQLGWSVTKPRITRIFRVIRVIRGSFPQASRSRLRGQCAHAEALISFWSFSKVLPRISRGKMHDGRSLLATGLGHDDHAGLSHRMVAAVIT